MCLRVDFIWLVGIDNSINGSKNSKMTSNDKSNFPTRVKIVARFFQILAVLCVLLMVGSGLGPAVDSQAPAANIELVTFALLAIIYFLTGNYLMKLKVFALWAGIGICLMNILYWIHNLATRGGSPVFQVLLIAIFALAAVTLHFAKPLFLSAGHKPIANH